MLSRGIINNTKWALDFWKTSVIIITNAFVLTLQSIYSIFPGCLLYIYCVRRYLPSCLLSRLLAGFRWSQKSLGNYTGSFNISAFSFSCLLMILLFIYAAEAVEFLSQGFGLKKLVWGGLSPTTWAYSKISDFVYIVDLFRVVWDVADGGRQKGKVHLSASSCSHYFSSSWVTLILKSWNYAHVFFVK